MGLALLQPVDEKDGGEKISPRWETKHGHAIAAARYGVLGYQSAPDSPLPSVPEGRNLSYIESVRAKKNEKALEALDALEAKMGPPHYDRHKYEPELEALRAAL